MKLTRASTPAKTGKHTYLAVSLSGRSREIDETGHGPETAGNSRAWHGQLLSASFDHLLMGYKWDLQRSSTSPRTHQPLVSTHLERFRRRSSRRPPCPERRNDDPVDANRVMQYRIYRCRRIPIYKPPHGIGSLEKVRGVGRHGGGTTALRYRLEIDMSITSTFKLIS
jgi:hypothetical protein